MNESVSPGLTLYLIVVAVGPAVGVGGGSVTGIIVIGAVGGRGVRLGVGVKPKPNCANRDAPPSTMYKTAQTMTMSNMTPPIASHVGTPSLDDSPKCAGTRCNIFCLRQDSELPGREGGGTCE